MKKFFSILISAMLLVSFFTGCQKEESSSTVSSTAQATLAPAEKVYFDVTATVPAKNVKAGESARSIVDLIPPYKTDKDKLAVNGVCVIRGKVVSSDYLLEGSTVYTKSNVKIEEVFKGNLNNRNTITVREMGGFVPFNVLSRAIEKEKYGTETEKKSEYTKIIDDRAGEFKVMEKDEEVILFVVPMKNSTKNLKGCYELVRLWQGKLLYNEELDAYVPYIPAEELCKDLHDEDAKYSIKSVGEADNEYGVQARIYTLDEFRNFIAENK